MSDGEPNYGLILPFPSDSKDFALGFEAGRVWRHIGTDELPFTVTMHAANAEIVLRMAEAQGIAVRSEDADEHYIHVTFGASNPTQGEEGR